MQSVIRKSIWVLILTASFAIVALADEAWTSNFGVIEYEEDFGNTAIFSYATPGVQNSKTRLFINELVPDVKKGKRGSYSGYWTDNSSRKTCEATLVDPMGTSTQSWGRFEITFTKDEDNYWNWTGNFGDCFKQPTTKITAKPMKGE